jgi:hypothetical protein
MKTPNTSSMLIARRFACAIAALAMLIWTCTPAQAEFDGTLQGNQLWTVELDNSNNAEAAAAAIYSIDKMGKAEYFQIATVPGVQLITLTVTKVPKGTVRVIIEVDPALGLSVAVRVIQGENAFGHGGAGDFRMVFDVI